MIFRKHAQPPNPQPDSPLYPTPKQWCYADFLAHYGSTFKWNDAICRAAILNDCDEVPWDWKEVVPNYYQASIGLTWSNERLIAELRKTQAKLDELRFRV